MITCITHNIKISESEAKKKRAYYSEGATYNKVKEELTFKVKKATNKNFRLVYINGKVVTLVDGTDLTITMTLHIIEEFSTIEQALSRIEKLGLEYTSGEKLDGKGKGMAK